MSSMAAFKRIRNKKKEEKKYIYICVCIVSTCNSSDRPEPAELLYFEKENVQRTMKHLDNIHATHVCNNIC